MMKFARQGEAKPGPAGRGGARHRVAGLGAARPGEARQDAAWQGKGPGGCGSRVMI